MKPRSSAMVVLLALAVVLLPSLELTDANFYPVPSLLVTGPSKVSYGPNSASFDFSVDAHVSMDTTIVCVNHSLDGSQNITSTDLKFSYWSPPSANLPNNHRRIQSLIALNSIGQGNHTLKVYAIDDNGDGLSRTMDFLVTPNSVIVYSPAGSSLNPADYAHPTPTQTPSTVPMLPLLVVLPLLAFILSTALILWVKLLRKRK